MKALVELGTSRVEVSLIFEVWHWGYINLTGVMKAHWAISLCVGGHASFRRFCNREIQAGGFNRIGRPEKSESKF